MALLLSQFLLNPKMVGPNQFRNPERKVSGLSERNSEKTFPVLNTSCTLSVLKSKRTFFYFEIIITVLEGLSLSK